MRWGCRGSPGLPRESQEEVKGWVSARMTARKHGEERFKEGSMETCKGVYFLFFFFSSFFFLSFFLIYIYIIIILINSKETGLESE